MLVETIPSSTRLEQQEVVHAGNGLPGCFPSTSSKESMGHSKNVMSKELVLCCDPAMWWQQCNYRLQQMCSILETSSLGKCNCIGIQELSSDLWLQPHGALFVFLQFREVAFLCILLIAWIFEEMEHTRDQMRRGRKYPHFQGKVEQVTAAEGGFQRWFCLECDPSGWGQLKESKWWKKGFCIYFGILPMTTGDRKLNFFTIWIFLHQRGMDLEEREEKQC